MYEAKQRNEKVSRRIDSAKIGVRHIGDKLVQKKSLTRGVLQRAALIIVKSVEVLKDNNRIELLVQATQRLSSTPPICIKIKKQDTVVFLNGDQTTPIKNSDDIDILGHSYEKLPGGFNSQQISDLLEATFNIPQNWNGNIRIFSCSVGSQEKFQANLLLKMQGKHACIKSVQASTQPVNLSNRPPVKSKTWKVLEKGGNISMESFESYNPSASVHGFWTEEKLAELKKVALKNKKSKIREDYERLKNAFSSIGESFKGKFPHLYHEIEVFLSKNKKAEIDYDFDQEVNILLDRLNKEKEREKKIKFFTIANKRKEPPIIKPNIPVRGTNTSSWSRRLTVGNRKD